MGVIVVGGTIAHRPYAPVLQSPPSGSFLDLAGTPQFVWQYNPGQPGLSQTDWLFERRSNGSVVAQYWNMATGLWQANAVWNDSTPSADLTNTGPYWYYTFPSGSWVDGNVYQWAVASKDANGTGPISPFNLVTAQQAPLVTVLAPTGTVTQANPTITWATVFAPGARQLTYQVWIYTDAQVSVPSFVPGVGPYLYTTNAIGSNATTLDLTNIPLFLPTGNTYWAFVQVSETHALLSDLNLAGSYTSFTTSYTAPATSALYATATADLSTGCPMIQLSTSASATTNLLSQQDADPTLGLGDWIPGLNTTVTSDANGLVLTPDGTAVSSAGILPGLPVLPNTEYSFMANFLAQTTPQLCFIYVQFYSGFTPTGYAQIGYVTDNASTPTQSLGTATSGPTDDSVKIDVYADAFPSDITDVHYVTEIGMFPGVVTTWSPGYTAGGLTGQAVIQRSDGAYVRNASINYPYTIPGSGIVTVNDYEAVPSVNYTYTLQILVTTGTSTVASDIGTSNAAMLTTTRWWELDPNNPAGAIEAQVIAWQPQITEQSTARLVMGQATPNVVASTMGGLDGQATFETFDPITYQTLRAMLTSQTTIFVSSPWGPMDTTYVRFGPQTGGGGGAGGNKIVDSTLLPSTYANMHRTTQITWAAQARPPV